MAFVSAAMYSCQGASHAVNYVTQAFLPVTVGGHG